MKFPENLGTTPQKGDWQGTLNGAVGSSPKGS